MYIIYTQSEYCLFTLSARCALLFLRGRHLSPPQSILAVPGLVVMVAVLCSVNHSAAADCKSCYKDTHDKDVWWPFDPAEED